MRGNFLIISYLLSFFKEIRVKNKDVVFCRFGPDAFYGDFGSGNHGKSSQFDIERDSLLSDDSVFFSSNSYTIMIHHLASLRS